MSNVLRKWVMLRIILRGQALMGQAAGDHVRLDIDGEVRELEVLGIENALS